MNAKNVLVAKHLTRLLVYNFVFSSETAFVIMLLKNHKIAFWMWLSFCVKI